VKILSIDPGLRKTGFAVIEKKEEQDTIKALTFGVICNQQKALQSSCLVNIRNELNLVIGKYKPEECAVESVIYVQSYKTAITMGAARAAAIIAAASHGIPVYEYAPKRIKQAVVGKGAAKKEQVAFMIRALLSLKETPTSDAADAIAVGLAHLYTAEGVNISTGNKTGPI
jgi:crossover junction endodeoxyribonuclease RuvC|tara:strand:+ start:283 stop:795 length:513 start_codon:yes stop_codon:yes gene_type:complete